MAAYLAAMASGFAALVFEILLFRRLELLLGRSVEASALIFAAYMLGLALGAGLARAPWSQRAPGRWYVGLELAIGAAGLALVLWLPLAAPLVAGLPPWAGGLLLLTVLLLPTTAMGWVLPLLAEVALPRQAAFHLRFPRLYAANTLGAMAGALLAVVLLRAWGLPVAALAACAANLLAAGLIRGRTGLASSPGVHAAAGEGGRRLLVAAAFSGALMLALEVLWLRALLLQLRGTDWLLASLLCVVIGGLSLGSAAVRRLPLGGWLALAWAGVLLGHALLGRAVGPSSEWVAGLYWSLLLAGPAALASGAIFARLGQALRAHSGSSQRAGARLLICNTLGAAAGALLMAWVILPTLGLARSWMLALAGYALLPLLLYPRARVAALATAALLLPLLLPDPAGRWFGPAVRQFPGYRLVERREAVDATLQLARRDLAGEAVAWRLITDGYSMSGTEADSLRYMRLFAQLPQALHGRIESALLVSYGLGNTAEALLADPRLRALSVVDTSAATLALSRRVRPTDPLADRRVHARVDDGRHLLLVTDRRFDLITAEPPPPRLAGVVNLYTREYFALAHDRLHPGGMLSHWLPVDQLSWPSTQAVVRSFCDVFADCSLWAGAHYNWILLGSRPGPRPAADLGRPWREPAMRRLLQDSGLERPGQLATSFIADARDLAAWVGPGPLLDDDHPGRLALRPVTQTEMLRYFNMMDDALTEQRFVDSAWVRERWPPRLREQAGRLWLWQPILNGQVHLPPEETAQLAALSLRVGLRAPLLRLLQMSEAELAAGQQLPGDQGAWYHGVAALLDGRWVAARQALARARHPAAGALAEVAACFADGICEPAM